MYFPPVAVYSCGYHAYRFVSVVSYSLEAPTVFPVSQAFNLSALCIVLLFIGIPLSIACGGIHCLVELDRHTSLYGGQSIRLRAVVTFAIIPCEGNEQRDALNTQAEIYMAIENSNRHGCRKQ